MSNYPPGVTGHEPQIAGPRREVEESREVGPCERFEGVNVVQVTRQGWEYAEGTFTGTSKRHIVRRAKGRSCTFEGGEVEGVTEDALFIWECPSCKFENVVDVEEDW